MRIAVPAIPEHGRVFRFDLTTGWAVEAARCALEADPNALQGELTLRREKTTVYANGTSAVRCERLCERCGLPLTVEVSGAIDLAYHPEITDIDELDRELADDDLDVGWYRDDHITVGDILSEAVALQLPARLACADVAACDSRTADQIKSRQAGQTGHPAFQVLRDLN